MSSNSVIKLCRTCKYWSNGEHDYPCVDCCRFSKWESHVPPSEPKEMTREILFRGKQVYDDGAWIEGVLINIGDYCCILPHDCEAYGATYLDSKTGMIDGSAVPVRPGTVGQFTGLYDMHGKMVFEGDIIQRYKSEFEPPRIYKEPYVVNIKSEFPSSICEYYSPFECFDEKVIYEIVGNIYDDPYFLKGEN